MYGKYQATPGMVSSGGNWSEDVLADRHRQRILDTADRADRGCVNRDVIDPDPDSPSRPSVPTSNGTRTGSGPAGGRIGNMGLRHMDTQPMAARAHTVAGHRRKTLHAR